MPLVVGIRFKDSGKIYFFDPQSAQTLEQGEHVIVETVRGLELAKVAHPPREVPESEVVGELKPVVRRAEAADLERLQALNERQDEVLARCNEKIQEHRLPMRLVRAEYSFDGTRLTFYFTAERRVDFRLLVRDLARTFRARIELRQIGPRDEAKLLGGIGPCGRLLCCATFLPDYARVSIKMAKDQDLPLNPTKISGVCGRLLCCLSYEHEQYLEIKEELPRKGAWVQTPDGPGEVVSVNVVRETVTVEIAGSDIQEEYKPAQLQEATRRVGELAHSRNEAGITPAAREHAAAPQRTGKPPRDLPDLSDVDVFALLDEPAEQQPTSSARNAQSRPRQRKRTGPAAHQTPARGQQSADGRPRRSAEASQRSSDPRRQTTPSDEPSSPGDKQRVRRRKRRGGRGSGSE